MKYDWQKICDGFAKELKQFLEKNDYGKFSLYECGFRDNFEDSNAKFLIAFCKHYNIPINTGILNKTDLKYYDCEFSDHNYDFIMKESEYATICPIVRSEQFINCFLKTEYLLSTIHPLTWAFESDIKQMSKVIKFDYVPLVYAGDFTGIQLEWVEMQDLDYKIIRDPIDPSKNSRWLGYTADQRELVAKVYSLHLRNKNNFQSCVQVDSSKFKQ